MICLTASAICPNGYLQTVNAFNKIHAILHIVFSFSNEWTTPSTGYNRSERHLFFANRRSAIKFQNILSCWVQLFSTGFRRWSLHPRLRDYNLFFKILFAIFNHVLSHNQFASWGSCWLRLWDTIESHKTKIQD